MPVLDDVAAIAVAQHGCVRLAELRGLDLSEGRIRTLVHVRDDPDRVAAEVADALS